MWSSSDREILWRQLPIITTTFCRVPSEEAGRLHEHAPLPRHSFCCQSPTVGGSVPRAEACERIQFVQANAKRGVCHSPPSPLESRAETSDEEGESELKHLGYNPSPRWDVWPHTEGPRNGRRVRRMRRSREFFMRAV